jgi:uncharacterized protein YbjT (DUF2867 family)
MKIVVIGGSGLIGRKTVALLRAGGHAVVAASPSAGIDAVTGEGLAAALEGAEVVVDVANSPSFEDQAVMDFFTASGRNLLAAEVAAGVKHHVALSVVGTERLQTSGYFRAKLVQEDMIAASPVPWTIVRATQFFEFTGAIAAAGTEGERVRLSTALYQPIASDDVARAVADAALAAPTGAIVEVAGPEKRAMAELVADWMRATGDARPVIADPQALYFGTVLDDASLTPAAGARIMPTRFADWLARQAAPVAA